MTVHGLGVLIGESLAGGPSEAKEATGHPMGAEKPEGKDSEHLGLVGEVLNRAGWGGDVLCWIYGGRVKGSGVS